MRLEDIEVHFGEPDRPYLVIGPLKERILYSAVQNALGQKPKPEAVYAKLREKAASIGANAVIHVSHKTTLLPSGVEARGLAVLLESTEVQCAFCAEWIKREARLCRFCGRPSIPIAASQPAAVVLVPRPCWCRLVKGDHDVSDHPST